MKALFGTEGFCIYENDYEKKLSENEIQLKKTMNKLSEENLNKSKLENKMIEIKEKSSEKLADVLEK